MADKLMKVEIVGVEQGADREIKLIAFCAARSRHFALHHDQSRISCLQQIQGLEEGNVVTLQNAGEGPKSIFALESVTAAIQTRNEAHTLKHPGLLIPKSQKIHQPNTCGFGRYCAHILRQHPL